MSELKALMIAPAPAVVDGLDIYLDTKFATGMAVQAGFFPGQFDCLLRRFTGTIPFGTTRYDPETANFGLKVIEADAPITVADLAGYDIIQCSADDDRNLALGPLLSSTEARLAGTLEYTLATRLDINAAEQGRNWPRRLVRNLRLRLRHRKRLRFLAEMDSLQANGYPALGLCSHYDPGCLLYLDNRMTPRLFATKDDMAARREHLLNDAPLRLMFSGRLEAMKGAQDLIPVARVLREKGVPFSLDIFGTGSLEKRIAADIARYDLAGQVTLHEPVDFESELVPHMRRNADVFLCCHRQADPSCSYIEAMACGLAVAGFDNEMWAALCDASRGGAVAPMGNHAALAERVAQMHRNRAGTAQTCEQALEFARGHGFEELSAKRMAHLAQTAVG